MGIPTALKNLDVPKHRYAYRRRGDTLVVKMHDKKIIFLLSTIHNADLISTGKRNSQNQVKRRLKVNHDYNRFMGGVDKNDSMVQTYSALRKSYKWYKKVAFHFIEEAVQNAYIVYKQQPGKRLEHYQFILAVVEALLAEADAERTAAATAEVGHHRLVGCHYLQFIPATANRTNPTRKCKVCKAQNKRVESRYQCKTCPDHPTLCVVPCHERYHSKQNY